MASIRESAITTIRLSPREQKALVDDMESRTVPAEIEKERRSVRVTFNIGEVKVLIASPGGDPVAFSVVPRNLSSGGMAFIHGQFAHIGAKIVVTLPRLYDVPLEVNGEIVRCRHVKGLLHEIGVIFEDEIDIQQFVKLSRDQVKQVAVDTGSAITGHVIIALFDDKKQPIKFSIMPRKFDDKSMVFNHGRYFKPDSPCVVGLTVADGTAHRVVGRIVDCHVIEEGVHAVKINFEQELDLESLYGSDHEAVSGSQLENESVLRTLIVDDSEADRQLIGFRLAQKGYEIQEAYGGLEAADAVRKGGVDLILLDIFLDGECGYDVAKAIRQMGFTGPIVALSADERSKTPADALRAGCNAFLTKPVDLDELQKAIHQLVTFDVQWEQIESHDVPFGPIHSSLLEDGGDSPQVKQFVESIGDRVDELQAAIELEDLKCLNTVCELLKVDGVKYGYEPVADFSVKVSQSLAKSGNINNVKSSVDDLVAILLRVVP